MGRSVCAWCGKDMGEAVIAPDLVTAAAPGKVLVSHGICEECEVAVRRENGFPPKKQGATTAPEGVPS